MRATLSAAPESIQRETLDRLQSELSSRQSTVHFAHAGVASVFAFILLGASMKLVWDAKQSYWMALVAFVPAALAIAYAAVRVLDGRKTLKTEEKRFSEMLELRRELKLDDPAALLPPQ